MSTSLVLLLLVTGTLCDPTIIGVGWKSATFSEDFYLLSMSESGVILNSSNLASVPTCSNNCPYMMEVADPNNNQAYVTFMEVFSGTLYQVTPDLQIQSANIENFRTWVSMVVWNGVPLTNTFWFNWNPRKTGYLLETWDIATNTSKLLYNITDPAWASARLTIDPVNNILYSIRLSNGYYYDSPGILASVDLNSGKVSSVAIQNVNVSTEAGLFYSASLKTMYVVDANAGLWSVDVSSGSPKKLATLPGFSWNKYNYVSYGVPVLNDAKGVIYYVGANSGSSSLYIFDLKTLVVTANTITKDGGEYQNAIPLLSLASY